MFLFCNWVPLSLATSAHICQFGKGNTMLAEMHVEGVKKLVNLRGGITAVRQTSPLTARMISWLVCLDVLQEATLTAISQGCRS
jgi:hypothetical protein